VTPEEALARAAIRVTQNAYHAHAERGRGDLVAELFAPGGLLEFSAQTHEGRTAISAALSGVGRTPPTASPATQGATKPAASPGARFFLRHHLTTSHVEFVSDTEARGWSYFLVVSGIGLDHAGRYIDTYVADGGDWLFASRRVSLDWKAEDSVV
jgi:hypothetical protein